MPYHKGRDALMASGSSLWTEAEEAIDDSKEMPWAWHRPATEHKDFSPPTRLRNGLCEAGEFGGRHVIASWTEDRVHLLVALNPTPPTSALSLDYYR